MGWARTRHELGTDWAQIGHGHEHEHERTGHERAEHGRIVSEHHGYPLVNK
jgi:hypothetical protein